MREGATMTRIYPSANKKLNPVVETKGEQERKDKQEQKDKPPGLRLSDVRKMNTAQLTLMAHRYGVGIEGCKNNDQRADLIIEAIEKAKADGGNDNIESGGI